MAAARDVLTWQARKALERATAAAHTRSNHTRRRKHPPHARGTSPRQALHARAPAKSLLNCREKALLIHLQQARGLPRVKLADEVALPHFDALQLVALAARHLLAQAR